MSFERAKAYLKKKGFASRIIIPKHRSATVAEAAEALGCEPGMIAKTLSFLQDGKPVLILAEGMARIDNRKYRERFGCKAKMIPTEQVEDLVGHDIGGVCPFGVNEGVKTYLDVSLKLQGTVYPATGTDHSGVRLTIPELEACCGDPEWVDVCREAEAADAASEGGRQEPRHEARPDFCALDIRTAEPENLETIMEIYRHAQDFMIASGNPRQWGHEYPPEEQVTQDTETGVCRVVLENGRICGVFSICAGEEPSYRRIEEGTWLNQEPYLTIHRIAGDGSAHGIFRCASDYAKRLADNIRIDTHADNRIMQRQIEKQGFVRCGTVFIRGGSPRIAYQWSRASGSEKQAQVFKKMEDFP